MRTDKSTGDVTFSAAEMKSLARLVKRVDERVGSLVNDGDWLGWDHYDALMMWDEILQGKDPNDMLLNDYVHGKRKGAITVMQWLEKYGEG